MDFRLGSKMKSKVFLMILALVPMTMFSSCWYADPVPDGPEDNNAWVYNNTPDTLMLQMYVWPQNKETYTWELPPYDTTFLMAYSLPYAPYDSYWGWMATRDTSQMRPVSVYKDSVLIIQWNPPCRDMGDTHSWYNEKSWSVVTQGIFFNKKRSTFPITEADYGHFF